MGEARDDEVGSTSVVRAVRGPSQRPARAGSAAAVGALASEPVPAGPEDPSSVRCPSPRFEGVAVGQSGVLVVWSWDEILVGVPGAARLERVTGLPRSHAVAVLDDGTLAVAADDGLHLRHVDGTGRVRPVPFGTIDRVEVTAGRIVLLSRDGLAIDDGPERWRTERSWMSSLSRAHVRGAAVEVLHVEAMSCVGSWTVRTTARLARMGRGAALVERPFPDERGRDPHVGVPDSLLASLDWGIGARGWIYAADGDRVRALRGDVSRVLRVPADPGEYSRLRVGHDGQRTFALYGALLLELAPPRVRVLDRAAPRDAHAIAVDRDGRPVIVAGTRVLRWRDGAWAPIAGPCSAGDAP